MKKYDWLAAFLLLLLYLAQSSSVVSIKSEYEFSQRHYNATVFKYQDMFVLPHSTLVSLATTQMVTFRVTNEYMANFFVPRVERVGGITFMRLLTTNKAANIRNFTGTLEVPIVAEFSNPNITNTRCTLHVKVLTMLEMCPFISATSYTFSIDSSQSLFSTIGNVQVEVPTVGDSFYVLYLRDLSPVFALNPHTGALVLTSRPRQKEYRLRAIVVNPRTRNCQITEKYTDVQVTVIVKDLDRAPVSQITASVTLLAYVANFGQTGCTFAWLNLTGASNRSSVQILNSEANNYFEFVRAADSAFRMQLRNDYSFTAISQRLFNVNYSVSDPADRANNFTGHFLFNPNDRSLLGLNTSNKYYAISVPECMPVGSVIFQFRSTLYKQKLSHIRFSYSLWQANSYLHLDEATGVLLIKSPLDAESSPKLTAFARIRDADYSSNLNFHTLTVTVLDCNEFAPAIENNSTVHGVPETATVGTTVLTVEAKDPDAMPTELLFSMPDNPAVPFVIQGSRIVVTRVLDSETMAANYTLYVRVSDQGKPIPRESLAVYYVNIEPKNEFRPEFEYASCTFDLWRSEKNFETGQFPAIDLDYPFAPVAYSIKEDGTGNCFSIISTTGNLKLACDLSQISGDQMALTIVATDRDGRESPQLPLRFNILANLQFADSRRRCVQHERSVSQLNEANRRARTSHELSVRVFESLQARSFAVRVPNRPPVLNTVQASAFSVPESVPLGHVVASFIAEDPDPQASYNGRLQFRIESGNEGFVFNVSQGGSGEDELGALTVDISDSRRVNLVVLNMLDRERRESYLLSITVCDMGEPIYCATLNNVLIRVLDVNDNRPQFEALLSGGIFEITVAEDKPVGTELYRFVATDPDEGLNGTVRYSVSDTSAFSIDSITGMLRTASRDLLDREYVSAYDLLVRAHDSGQPRRSADLHFRVIITDENDHAPTFITRSQGQADKQTLAVSEDTPVNAFLTRLIAIDSDAGDNGRIVYSLSGLPDVVAHFLIDQDSGCLHLAKSLSAERSPYQLFVRARDCGASPKRSELFLSVNVIPAVPPPIYIIFNQAVYSFSLREDAKLGTKVGSVETVGKPGGGATRSMIGYVITAGSGLGRFTIDHAGDIRTRSLLDRESQPDGYWLTVHAFLRAGQTSATHAEEKISLCRVYISLEDVNDFRPMPKDQVHYRLNLVENSPSGTVLLNAIPAYDLDLGNNSKITYAIVEGNSAGYFVIDSATGRLSTTETAVDREAVSEFLLTVSLTDAGQPSLSTSLLVEVSVLDVNDSPPQFLLPYNLIYAFSSDAENGAPPADDRMLLTRLVAVDPDLLENATTLYSLLAPAEGIWITEATGDLWISRQLLTHGRPPVMLTVVAKDAAKPDLRSMASVKVEAAPAPLISDMTSDLFEIAISGSMQLPEDLPLAVMLPNPLIIQNSALGSDSQRIVFNLTGNGSEDFYLPQTGGRLNLVRRLSYQRQAHYNLTVSARFGSRQASKQLEMQVSQVNRHSPMFSQPAYFTAVSESGDGAHVGGRLLQLVATDPDPGPSRLQYSLAGAAQDASLGHFSVEPLTGRLLLARPLNHESAASHELVVKAVDSYANGRRTTLAKVAIRVDNENEHYPVVIDSRPVLAANLTTSTDYEIGDSIDRMSLSPMEPALIGASVLANVHPGYPLAQVYAFDLDSGRSGQLEFSIVSGNEYELFAIDADTGLLTTRKLLLDFAEHSQNLRVAVTDKGVPPKTSLCAVDIRIVNHEPNRPVVFNQKRYSVKIVEEAPPGSFVIKVDATANDMPLVYSIISGNELGLFDIAPSTGVLIVKSPVDRETHGDFFRLGVQVQAVETRLAVLTEVLVNVLDVNDNQPVFLATEYTGGLVSEDAPVGRIVYDSMRRRPLTLKAIDADFGENQELTYEIADADADAAFLVDPVTGALHVRQPLDRELRELYEFDVWARDGGSPRRLRSTRPARVRVRLLDVNDCPPQYTQADYYVVLELPSFDGAHLARIETYDRDLNNSVSLSIASGNVGGVFSLQQASGLLTLARADLIREHFYFLVIRASDSVHESLSNISINAKQRPANLELHPANLTVWVPENSAEVVSLAKLRPYPAPLNYPYRFSLVSPSDHFSVNAITGVLATTGRPLDAEEARRHVLLVRASADSKLGFSQVTVLVGDVNDNRPIFVGQPYSAVMYTGQAQGSLALAVRAIDSDWGENGTVSYELLNQHSLFWVNSSGGQVYTRQVIQRPGEFNLHLRAFDQGRPIHQFSSVYAKVQVVSQETPVFPVNTLQVSVKESLIPGSVVTTVQAKAPGRSTLIYTIEGGNEAEMFSLDFQTGVVKTTDKLDYEQARTYQLQLRVTEPSTKIYSELPLVIEITDVNDERPIFKATSFEVSVSEHEDANRNVLLTAVATDADSGPGGEVTYSIEELGMGYTDGESFSIDPTGGQMRLKRPLDYETKRTHQFWIVATDRGVPPLSARIPITVRVTDYNDCPPVFRSRAYNVSIAGQSLSGTFVAKVTAVDADESSTLTYSLESSFDSYQFRIDPDYGTIRYQPIQASLGLTFRLAVLVTDSVHSDRATVTVTLLPAPSGPPRCTRPLFHAHVQENQLPGERLLQIQTTGGTDVTYRAFSDRINRLLEIDRHTGWITTKVTLDREGDGMRTLDFPVLASAAGGFHATCSVVISVLNLNDNPPSFELQPTEALLADDSPAGSVVFQLRATDLDDPTRPIDNYRLISSDPLFLVNSTTGFVTLSSSFANYSALSTSRGTERLRKLTVLVTDWEPPFHETRLDLTVRFAPPPLPDFRLLCDHHLPDMRIRENSPAGTQLVTCRAQFNGSATTAYQAGLTFGEGEAVWLRTSSDHLTVSAARPFDREREAVVKFALLVRSAGTEPVVPVYRAFQLDVENLPDTPPAFETFEYSLEVSESVPQGSPLLQARAIDPDGDFTLTYALLGNDASGYHNDSLVLPGVSAGLRIGQDTGLVTTAGQLDRESSPMREFRLRATDASGMTGEARLLLTLIDVNDEPLVWPTDEDGEGGSTLSEAAPVGTSVARLRVTDRDSTDKPPVRFYFASRPPSEFDITEDGLLVLSGPLDRERRAEYDLEILATDGVFTTKLPRRHRVTVRDENDNAPVCQQPLRLISLSEGLPLQSKVATVVATDADSSLESFGQVRYSIANDTSGLFAVGRISGEVILSGQLDRETRDHHTVTVLASDGLFSCATTLEIRVLDENDCAPVFTARSLPPVPEDIPQGSVIGKVHAEDCDTGVNRRVSYSIQPNVPEAAYFRIDPKSGIISVDFQKLDRETTPVHRIPVIARDSGTPPLSTTQTVSLTLMDVNDNPPEFERSSMDFSLSEATPVGHELTQLRATSKDTGNNAVIRYQLMDHDSYFNVSSIDGVLRLKSQLDYERQQIYYLTVKAYDLGEPPLSATAVVTVKVLDENDNAPRFPDGGFRVSIKENERPNTRLDVDVVARDADSGENARLTYRLVDGDPDRMFALDSNTGQLYLRNSPDRETKDSYVLTVTATDHGSPPLSATTTVRITVLDVNDCVPQFDRPDYAFVLQIDDRGNVSQQPYMDNGEFLPPDGNLISVTDCDAPPNGAPFSWSIVEGSMRYSITNGRIRAKPGGGYTPGIEKLKVQACDSGDIIRCNHTTALIRTVKADSVPPKILPVNMTSNFYYKLQPTVHIGDVQLLHHRASDVQLSLLTHSDLFRVTRQGSILTRESLPHGTYRLRVKAVYRGLESDQDVTVRVNLVTDEMVANAAILRITNESAFAFFYNRVDARIVDHFSSALGLPVDNVYIVTVQQQQQQLLTRLRRATTSASAGLSAGSTTADARNEPLLVLLSVYDSRAGAYISPAALQRLPLDGLSAKLGRSAIFVTDCPASPCQNSGSCHLVPEPLSGQDERVVTAHASFLSPKVRLAPYCACPDQFTGPTCQLSQAACNCRPDQRCHRLAPGHHLCLERDAGCDPASVTATTDCTSAAGNASVVHLRGAGGLVWSLNDSAGLPTPASPTFADDRSFAVDVEFRMRTLQNQPGPVLAIHWTPDAPQLRDIVLMLGQDGALQVAPAVNGRVQPRPWAVSRRPVNDGRWHSVRLRLMRESASRVARSENALRNWTVELLVDSIEPTLRAIPWSDAPDHKRLSTGRGYVGCLSQMRMNGLPLPLSSGPAGRQAAGQPQPVALTSSEGVAQGCSEPYFGTACAVAPCQHAGVCSNTLGGFQCQCASPYIGRQCEINTEPCAESPCLNGATCRQSGRHFTCECPAGLSGTKCEFGLYCGRDVNPCENGARCEESPSGAICHCGGTGYQGATCSLDVDECAGGHQQAAARPCGLRGTCVNVPGSYYCNCSLGYSGRSCETFHVPGVDGGNAALLGLSFNEIVAILSSVSIILLLALSIFFVVSYCSRRRSSGAVSTRHRRGVKDQAGVKSAASSVIGSIGGGGGGGSYRQCAGHDPAEAMALVTLASGETCMVPQRQLDLRHSVPNCYSSEHNLPEAAAAAASYAAYDKPHPPRPFSFYSDTAGTPTRCLTPSCTATISRRPHHHHQQQQQLLMPHHHQMQPAFVHNRTARLYARQQGTGSALGDIIDEQELNFGNVSPAGSHVSRQGYHWDTSDWNTGNPPDLIPDSPYCVYATAATSGGGGGGAYRQSVVSSECASQASSLAGSPAHGHSSHCHHHHQHQQTHHPVRPTPVHGGRMMQLQQMQMVQMGSSESLGAGSTCSGCGGGGSSVVSSRRPSLQRMLLANPGAYLPQYAGSACDFDEAREELEEADVDEEESSRAALLPGGVSGIGGIGSDQMTTSTSTFRGGGGGSCGAATVSTKTGGSGGSGSTEMGSGGSATPVMEERPLPVASTAAPQQAATAGVQLGGANAGTTAGAGDKSAVVAPVQVQVEKRQPPNETLA